MKESRLIAMEKRIEQITEVLSETLGKLQLVDQMTKGTLTAFQLHLDEDGWKELVIEMQAIKGSKPEPKEKKFETDVE